MREYDIYIKSMKDGKATVWLMMELYGVKLADANEAVKEGIAGAGVPETRETGSSHGFLCAIFAEVSGSLQRV